MQVSLHVFLSLFIPAALAGLTSRQYIETNPTNTTVSEGSQARLACRVANKVGDCQWTRNGFALGTDPSLPEFPRYRLEGCDLVIQPVVPLDEGQYQCQVGGGGGGVRSEEATLSVNCQPGQPYILEAQEGDTLLLDQGEEVELHCQSQGGKPPAEIQWWDGTNRISAGTRESATRMEDRKTWLTVSTLKFTPKAPMTVHCTVFNDAFPSPKSSEPLAISFKGFVKPKQISFHKNQSLELHCTENETKNDKYKWILNGNEVKGETENTLKLLSINESYDNSEVKCLTVGKDSVEEAVNAFNLVYDKEKIEKKEKSIISLKKSGNTKHPRRSTHKKFFTCFTEEEASPEPQYVWIDGKLEKSVSATRKVRS